MEIKRTGQGQLSKNSLLESLTKTHISVPLTIFFGASFIISLFCLWMFEITTSQLLLIYAIGFVSFTLIEYIVHRFVFHMNTYNAFRTRMQYLIHGVHHEYPKDKARLAMPPVASVSIAIVLFSIFWMIGHVSGLAFGAGFVAGYAFYLCIHYSVHAFKPPRNFLRILWRFHSIHHYKNHDVAYGVTSPFWDLVFRTLPK
ncbi:MAG: fatty acid hydroxylase [Bacteroidia bacterium]|nr:fatty acid hydroxylase [Bacteroidia bacterium]